MLTSFFICVTEFGSPVAISIFSLVLLGVLMYTKRYTDALWFSCYLLIMVSVVFGVKHILQIPRPIDGLISEDGYSFPSGHAGMTTTLMYALHRLWGMSRKKENQYLLVSVLSFFVIIIAYSRVYLGVHRPEDVIAGVGIAFLVGEILFFLKRKYFNVL